VLVALKGAVPPPSSSLWQSFTLSDWSYPGKQRGHEPVEDPVIEHAATVPQRTRGRSDCPEHRSKALGASHRGLQ
jgi:hypothetical protein